MLAKIFTNVNTLVTNVATLISNQRISTPPTIDQITQVAATGSHGTLYTVTNYTGQGVLCAVGQYHATSSVDCYFDLTIDGTNETWDANGVTSANAPFAGGANSVIVPFGGVRFDTSLLIKVANDNAGAADITGVCVYGIGSKEIGREVISAGNPIPAGTSYCKLHGTDRNEEVYDQDVMVITYLTDHGPNKGNISKRVIFPRADMVRVNIDPLTGKVSGQLKKQVFNVAVGGSLFTKEDLLDDREEVVEVHGVQYRVNVLKGVMQANKIPPVPVVATTVQDAR